MQVWDQTFKISLNFRSKGGNQNEYSRIYSRSFVL